MTKEIAQYINTLLADRERLLDERKDGGYVTPIECAGNDDTYISRIREDTAFDNGLSIWVVSDNLRKGAALNAVQILELLREKHLK